ncbi:AraC family transcriptional regulator [Chondromyces apiculatus]|uniref:Transcriptional regulator, AraC family n=1 Tax=Chondromyces apiculatus DSM 436 TaxID=1192034 RepID=A0A017T5G4_9BACT|nr:AraC family transcriptional regulator [Chondromyces apiculatus]EYF03811.1 Transcriptional regulator, AraC family [Chondromyces apiculatus DSM 436]
MKRETRSFYEMAVRGAVERIFDQLDDALDLTALARTAALSPLHFHRIFRGMLGETPLELHRRLRMERAAHQLATGDAPVTRVAFDAGYETHESFTRAFGDHYGVSPSAFRLKASEARAACARAPQRELAARCGLHFHPGQRPELSLSFTNTKGEPAMHVDLKDLPEYRLAAIRHVGPYHHISEAFGRLGEIAGRAGLIRPPHTEMIALYHDDPEATAASALRSDAAISVPDDVILPEGVTEIRIPARRYACTTHVGPYTKLGDTWAQFMGSWLPQSGHRVSDGPSFEIYRNTPGETPPEELRTEIYLPIA